MSTWHQQQNMPVLWHPTLWTVVFDPPDRTLSVERFKDPVETQHQTEACKAQNTYVLPPHK